MEGLCQGAGSEGDSQGQEGLNEGGVGGLGDQIDQAEGSQGDHQGEEDVLGGQFQGGTVECEVKGDFGDQGEEEQISGVFQAAVRVAETLDQEEAEDREGGTADGAEDGGSEVKSVVVGK